MSNAKQQPADELLELITGHWAGQIAHAGVKLGVFEALADAPRSADAVAETLELDPGNTYRLLRALGTLDFLQEHPDGSFEITEKGALMSSEHPQSFRSAVLLEHGYEFPAWTHLPKLVRTGQADGFKEEYGHSGYEFTEIDPEYAAVFNQAMTSNSDMEAAAVLDVLDKSDALTGVSHLCDVGGGRGYLLSHLLQEHANLTGEVLDLPSVVKEAGAVPEKMGVADRITFTGGDMFESVAQADGYIMKHNLHAWSDEECIQILQNIQAAAPKGAPVLSAEYVVTNSSTDFTKLYDIKIMVATGGRQRSLDEYNALFSQAGMKLAAHHQADDQLISVVEGRTA